MTTLEMLHAIEDVKIIYSVHWCRAGVGFQFYAGPERFENVPNWRQYVTVDRYYPSFEDAVAAEYARLRVARRVIRVRRRGR